MPITGTSAGVTLVHVPAYRSLTNGYVLSVVNGQLQWVLLSSLITPTTPGGSNGSVQYNNSSTFGGDNQLTYDDVTYRLGIQVGVGSEDAPLHVANNSATTIGDVGSVSAGLSNGNSIPDIGTGSAVQSTPNLPKPTGAFSNISYGSGSYTADGSTRDYRVYQAYDDGAGTTTYAVVGGYTSTTDDSSFNQYYVSIGWSSASGLQSPNTYRIYRQINGGGYNEYYDTTSSSFVDGDGSMSWNSGSEPPSPQYPDYIANGTARNYNAYGVGTSPSGVTVYSANPYFYNFTDDASDNSYLVPHSGSGTQTRVIGAADGSSANGYIDSATGTFTEGNQSWIAGNTVTPNSYGFFSDGSQLNRDYTVYAYEVINGVTIYSAIGSTGSTFDSNNGQYYYVSLSWGAVSGADGYVVSRNINGAGFNEYKVVASNSLFDDSLQTWISGSFTNTPTSYYPPTQILEQAATQEALRIIEDSAGKASILLKDTAGVTRGGWLIESSGGNHYFFKDGATTSDPWMRFGTAGNLDYNAPSNFSLKVGGTEKLALTSSALEFANGINVTFRTTTGTKIGTATNEKLAFWNTTPIVQPANTVAINDVLVNTGLRASGATSNFSTTIKPRTGGTAAGSAPLQFTSASLLTTATVGTQEFLTDKYYATITTGAARKEYTLNDAALTSSRVPFATTNGRLTDDADLTFVTDTLFATKVSVQDDAYAAGWNGSALVPTKNALYDKIEAVVASIPAAYTDEQAQDAVGSILTDSSTIDFTYNDGAPSITGSVITGAIDHNSLANLTTGDPHTQYALLAGRSGGQTIIGGTAAFDNLTLRTTSDAAKGYIFFGNAGTTNYDELYDVFSIGQATANERLQVNGNIQLSTGSTRSITVGTSTTGNGNTLEILAGTGFTEGNDGGGLFLQTGSGKTRSSANGNGGSAGSITIGIGNSGGTGVGNSTFTGSGTNVGGSRGNLTIGDLFLSSTGGIASNSTSLNIGGSGGQINFYGYSGGSGTGGGGTATNIGGAGGPVSFNAGAGGAATGGATNIAGAGGNVRFNSGNGGSTGTTGGNAGYLLFQGGVGQATAANGGALYFRGGTTSGSGIVGHMYLGADNSGIVTSGSRVIVNTATLTGGQLQVRATTEQQRTEYDSSNYYSTTVSSTGGVTFDAVGSGAKFNFSDRLNFASLAGSTTEGDIWADSTQKAMQVFSDGIEQTLQGTIFTQTADATVTNTTTETSIIGTGIGGLTLPANFWVAGKTIRITMCGVYSTVIVTGDTVTVKIKYGSTVLTSKATTALVTGGTNLAWEAEALITCRTTGGTGTVQVGGGLTYQVAGAAAVYDELNNGVATSTLDTTASGLLDITVTHSAANASNTVKSLVSSFEVLN